VDHEQFDGLARLVSARQTRRDALAAILGAALLGHEASEVLARTRRRGKVKAQTKAKAKAKVCYPGTRCTPGRGKNNAECSFSRSTDFVSRDVRGSNLSNTNFTQASAWGADFRGANLSAACFVDAILLGAKLDGSNLGGAVFCRTLMPDGTTDNSGCDNPTPCCPTEQPPQGGTCRDLYQTCGLLVPDACCDGLSCQVSIVPAISGCQKRCSSDAECDALRSGYVCRTDIGICPTTARCCVPR
jgi:hypothetical protein